MNRFILALLMFKNVYISQVNLKIMQINLQVTHTLILERKPVFPEIKNSMKHAQKEQIYY